MEINGQPYTPSNPLDARTHGIALIHQELSLCPHLSVAENILMGIESSRMGWLDRDKLFARTNEVLKTFHHADIRPEKRVGDLSVAARQIVEISRAIAARARIILMDEPTSSLQREDVTHLFALIRKLNPKAYRLIYISHFLEEVRQISDRLQSCVMDTALRMARLQPQPMMNSSQRWSDARNRICFLFAHHLLVREKRFSTYKILHRRRY